MAKFYGEIGYAGTTVESAPGVYKDVIVEHVSYGDVLTNSRSLREGDKVNQDISLDVTISILRDAYANEHYFAMRYVKYQGAYWIISNVKPVGVRLELRLGGVYPGPFPPATP